MSQLPGEEQEPAMNNGPAAPDPFGDLVQSHFDRLRELLQRIPEDNIRDGVENLINGRVIQRVMVDDVPEPQRQGVVLSFASFQETLDVFRLNRFLHQAVPYVTVVYNRYMEIPELEAMLEDWDRKDNVVAAVLTAAGPWLAAQGLVVVGFTASGIAAGSLAALWQSAIGNVAAGSLFASLQSAGAVGVLGGPLGIAAEVVAGTAYAAYKVAVRPTPEERFNRMLLILLNDAGERAKFWASINV